MILYSVREGLDEWDMLFSSQVNLRPWGASVRRKLWQIKIHFGQRRLGLGQRYVSLSLQHGSA